MIDNAGWLIEKVWRVRADTPRLMSPARIIYQLVDLVWWTFFPGWDEHLR